MDGAVKWFDKEKGYGFINVSGEKDHYFNINQVQGNKIPKAGDLVSFTSEHGPKGPRATDIVITHECNTHPKSSAPYYGKPTKTVGHPGKGFLGGAVVGSAVGGPVGVVVGGIIGAMVGSSMKKDITCTCLKCGGNGHPTAWTGTHVGFQCENCKSFWKKRI